MSASLLSVSSIAAASPGAAGKSGPKWEGLFAFPGCVSPDAAARIAEFLRRAHPRKTACAVAAATGGRVTAATAKKWLSGASAPGLFAALALLDAYGPDFLCAAMASPPAWLRRAAREEARARLKSEQIRLQGALERLEAEAG